MAKEDLCKDQREGLVAKLTAFFKGLTAEEIDDVVTKARQQASVETTQARKNELTELFDSQMKTIEFRLNSMNIMPNPILSKFRERRDEIIQEMLKIWTEHYPGETIESLAQKGRYLCIPVIPRAYLGICGLAAMIHYKDKAGYTYLNPNEITDQVETPKTLYFMLDVEDGKETLGKSPKQAEELIKEQKRSCLTADEGLALWVHSRVRSEHYVDCAGSRCKGADEVPNVCLNDDVPELDWRNVGYSNDEWGSASCRSRS